jgi:hypothetical protein
MELTRLRRRRPYANTPLRQFRPPGRPLIICMFAVYVGAMAVFAALSLLTPGPSQAAGPGHAVGGTLAGGIPVRLQPAPVLLIGLGVHVEPFGAEVSDLVVSEKDGPGGSASLANDGKTGTIGRRSLPDYGQAVSFARAAGDLETIAQIVESHGGLLTVQVQSPFTTTAAALNDTTLADLEARGHEIGLHFHEDAHLGPDCELLPASTWAAVMAQEISYIRATGVSTVSYWSGGNLYPGLIEAASLAGLEVMSDYKNPHSQATNPLVLGVEPWRPAEGPSENDLAGFAQHDPEGSVIYLPDGAYDTAAFAAKRQVVARDGAQAYFDSLARTLRDSLALAEPGEVSVFHITLHPGEFRGSQTDPYAILNRFLTEVVDPLVAAGRVQWSTFSQMAEAYEAWEVANPESDAREIESAR